MCVFVCVCDVTLGDEPEPRRARSGASAGGGHARVPPVGGALGALLQGAEPVGPAAGLRRRSGQLGPAVGAGERLATAQLATHERAVESG